MGKGRTKMRSLQRNHCPNMSGREAMSPSLQTIANKAKRDKHHRFQNLFGLLNGSFLLSCWKYIRRDAATGVDRVTAEKYGRHLAAHVNSLVERLKQGCYRVKLVLRRWIPKGKTKRRPLGLPSIEDKLLQTAVALILRSIYEADFLQSSHGYRPNRGARQAALELKRTLQFGRYRYIVEADIESFFDTVDHDWLMRMLKQRIDDQPFLRLIQKWLKAGILEEDATVVHPVTGTPQGGIVSPILSNIYLHYTLDLWFEHVVKKHCRGAAYICQYADD